MIDERVDVLVEDVRDVKRRPTSLEMTVTQVQGDFAGRSMRIDSLENRLDRIESRLMACELQSVEFSRAKTH